MIMTSIPARPAARLAAAAILLCATFAQVAYAHGVAEGDQGYIEQTTGP